MEKEIPKISRVSRQPYISHILYYYSLLILTNNYLLVIRDNIECDRSRYSYIIMVIFIYKGNNYMTLVVIC